MAAKTNETALVLSGGGARGAYQAGVIKALSEIGAKNKIENPMPIIAGTSAGSINAAFLAAHAEDLRSAGEKICQIWGSLQSHQVIRTDTISFTRIGFRLLKELTTGSFVKRKKTLGLLDTTPLKNLLTESIPFQKIQHNIDSGFLRALAITATNYANSDRVTFVQGKSDIKPWKKVRRRSEMGPIESSHVMASTAIPIFFPPIQVGTAFYGDGCLRNLTPLSPAIKLGAKNLIVVGVQKEIRLHDPSDGTLIMPTLARVVSVVTNAILMDNVYMDIERLNRINETVKVVEPTATSFRPINIVHIRPSQDIGKIAFEESEKLPATLKFLIDGLGSRREAAELISYLMFEGPYCQRLIDMGYQDALAQEKEICDILSAPS
ncbi:MAG: hypothetical protein A4S09_03905 [Proteobacteria bacterium SG_bin7]|nr:MAG: hypothetical protein A4S09_03905 [Proteobacteria bacterium SG_bin7]